MAKKTEELEKKIKELENQVQELSKKASERDEYYDKYLRTLADYDNAKRRMERDVKDFVKYANERIISDLFPILDSFDSAISTIEKHEKEGPFMDGLKMLQKNFHKILEENGLSPISTIGEKFDPIKHEAVMKIKSDKYEDGVVAEELRKGYILNGKVLRPAMVKVAEKKEESEQKLEDRNQKTEDENV